MPNCGISSRSNPTTSSCVFGALTSGEMRLKLTPDAGLAGSTPRKILQRLELVGIGDVVAVAIGRRIDQERLRRRRERLHRAGAELRPEQAVVGAQQRARVLVERVADAESRREQADIDHLVLGRRHDRRQQRREAGDRGLRALEHRRIGAVEAQRHLRRDAAAVDTCRRHRSSDSRRRSMRRTGDTGRPRCGRSSRSRWRAGCRRRSREIPGAHRPWCGASCRRRRSRACP